ncbi:MAG: NADH-quinone oxidoreductase subunit N [Holophaga sp.]|nr:NADH-quinone oxidoreductase subunit N [Holophaga sp.]
MLTTSELAVILPLAIPAAAACLLPIASLDRDQETVKWIRGSMFAIALFALAGSFLYVTRLWGTRMQPSFGQVHLDFLAQLAAIFILVTAALAVLQLWDHLHQEGWVKGETLSLLMFSVTGMLVFTATTNLIVIFLGLELLSVPLYALTATVRQRADALEGGMKYFITGAVASACFLMGSVLLYGMTGSFEIIEIGRKLSTHPDTLALAGAALVLVGFLFKVSGVPFHQWTPDAYEASPHPIAGFMSVATKGAAFIVLLRMFPAGLSASPDMALKFKAALAIAAALTMIVGNLTALAQSSVKRMLAYSSISHAGYLLLGLVAGTQDAYVGMLYYLFAYMAMNMGAFGLLTALGLVGDRCGFEHLRGLGWKRPGLGIAATLCMFSLAGIPPTGGFYGKYMIFKELIQTGHVGLAVLGVLASLVSVYFYLRVVVALFLEKPTEAAEREAAERPEVVAPYAGATVLVCGFLVVAIGFAQTLMVDGFALRAIKDSLHFMP